MAYIRKISDKQFLLDILNKQFEIAETNLHFDTLESLIEWSKDHKEWYNEYSFKTKEQYLAWKKYFYEHFYDWKPKRYPKRIIDKEFEWIHLNYGLKFDFDYKELYENS